VDDYGQWDMNASYQINDNFIVFADILNLTNETAYVHGRSEDQVLFATQLGTRYNVGLRYRF
jgi:outer membrane receptor protein involved in Fe transport